MYSTGMHVCLCHPNDGACIRVRKIPKDSDVLINSAKTLQWKVSIDSYTNIIQRGWKRGGRGGGCPPTFCKGGA